MPDPNANRPGYRYSIERDCWVPISGQAGCAAPPAFDGNGPTANPGTDIEHEMPAKGRAAPTHPGRPSDVEFERELVAKGLTAPRVTPQRIEEVIAGEYYFTALQGSRCSALDSAVDNGTPLHLPMPLVPALGLLTFCVLVLKNGFTVAGESACASPENFNAEAGRKAARNNAIGKIWPLEGYLLRQRLHDGYFEEIERQRKLNEDGGI